MRTRRHAFSLDDSEQTAYKVLTMRGAKQLNSLWRLPKPAALRGVSVDRYASTKTRQNQRSTEDDVGDFRPPWVYSGSRFLTYTAIPREAIPSPFATAIATLMQSLVTLLYCAFLADWGEREHIFMPVRCLLGHLALANQLRVFSCADGCQSISNRCSLYLLKKLLLFKETMDRHPVAPCHLQRSAHKYNVSTGTGRSHHQYNTSWNPRYICTEESSLIC